MRRRRGPPLAAAIAAGWLACSPAASQYWPARPVERVPHSTIGLIAVGASAATRRSDQSRPEFNGLYAGMPASELPASLSRTGNIGQLTGYLGPDYIEAYVWDGVLSELTVVYVAPALGSRPRIDRRLSLQDAWRLHSVGDNVPEFGLYMTHLYKVEGLVDTRNQIVYRLRFPQQSFSRTAPPLFDPETRVETVSYFKDRGDFASNYQPIPSAALLKLIAERYRDAVSR